MELRGLGSQVPSAELVPKPAADPAHSPPTEPPAKPPICTSAFPAKMIFMVVDLGRL